MKTTIKKEQLPLFVALCVAVIVLLLHLTNSPLWYDEAVEYYYSKIMIGEVPGEDTANMYQRICDTFQPPLYNVVMYFWLQIYDSEWWFRLLGVVVTLIGCVGIYKSVKLLTNDEVWSAGGAMFYALTPFVAYYALECAEYYLMLTFEVWSIFFFLKSLSSGKAKDYALFCLFASLAVYSQYGAAILEAVLFVALLVCAVKNKQLKRVRSLSACAAITIVVAGLPLLYFFLLQQLQHQGTTDVPHSFYFAKGNIIVDLINGVHSIVGSNFCMNSKWQLVIGDLVLVIPIIGLLRKRNATDITILCAMALTWLVYYMLVATSFYGYNNWNGQLGTHNLGGRYCLFMTPFLIILITIGTFRFINSFGTRYTQRLRRLGMTIGILGCIVFTIKIHYFGMKYDVRELVQYWYSDADKQLPTYVHNREYFNFLFYKTHDKRKEEVQDCKIVKIFRPANTKEDVEEKLKKAGAYQENAFYLVMSESQNKLSDFINVLNEHGFHYSLIYDGTSKLLYVKRNNE